MPLPNTKVAKTSKMAYDSPPHFYPYTHEHTYKSLLVEPCSAYKGLHCEEDGDESCMLTIFGRQLPSYSQACLFLAL